MGWAFVGARVRGKASLTWDDACVKARFDPRKRGISEVKCNSVRQVRVEGGGGWLLTSGCTLWGCLLIVWGWGLLCRRRSPGERAPGHDRGKVLTQAMLMLAGGGECCSDIEYLRAEGALFGGGVSADVVSDACGRWTRRRWGTCGHTRQARRDEIWARRAPVDAGGLGHRLDAGGGSQRTHKPARRRITRAATGFIRCCVSATTATRSARCCAPATRPPTASSTRSRSSTRRSGDCPMRSRLGTGQATTPS